MKLNDEHIDTFYEQGYVVVEDYYPEEKRARIAAQVRKQMPPWEELDEGSRKPEHGRADFPFDEMFFNRLILDQDLIDFVARVLGTEEIHFRFAQNQVRYPVHVKGEDQGLHQDNVNNSLLPVNQLWEYGQISSWYFPEDVSPDRAPMRIIPRKYGNDLGKCYYLAVPGNTLMIFNTHIWHSATVFQGDKGQRYSINRIYGRADHYWEGLYCFTNLGMHPIFRELVGTLTARQRQYFRFPPPGHAYYNEETLALLEEQYPGWNARGEYN